MRLVRIAELAVHFVGDEEEVVPLAEITDLEHLLLGEELAGRVARVADEHGTGLRGHEFLELGNVRDLETFADVGRDGLERDAVEVGEGLVVGVERLHDDDFVAGVGRDLHRHGEGLAARHVDEQLGDLDVDADLLVVLLHHALAEFDQAGGIGVGKVVHALALVHHGIERAVGRLDVRSADVEVIHVDTPGLGGVGERDQLADRGCRHSLGLGGNVQGHMLLTLLL